MREVVIVGAARTPIGSFAGALSSVSAPKLGATAIKGAIERAGVAVDQVDEVIMGCVLTAGVGQAPARQAAIYAGLPQGVPCLTINKVCGSGLKAVMLAAQAIKAGEADVVVAGGMENMSQVPHLLAGSRNGYRLGHQQMLDGMIKDGLWDVYNDFHMGNAAEMCVREHNLSREEQDAFARSSYEKALAAMESGAFEAEIVPVEVPQRRGDAVVVSRDEEPGRGRLDKLPGLRAAFEREGTVTAGNASSINDGAAALVIASADYAAEHGLPVLARISASTQHAGTGGFRRRLPRSTSSLNDEMEAGDVDCEVNGLSLQFPWPATSCRLCRPAGECSWRCRISRSSHRCQRRSILTLLFAMQSRDAKWYCELVHWWRRAVAVQWKIRSDEYGNTNCRRCGCGSNGGRYCASRCCERL